jgi:hypothetical protein
MFGTKSPVPNMWAARERRALGFSAALTFLCDEDMISVLVPLLAFFRLSQAA